MNWFSFFNATRRQKVCFCKILQPNLSNMKVRVHLLFESICDLQLHQQNTLPDIQLLVQILEARLDVLFNGSSLIGQLLEDLLNEGQGI